MSVASNVEFEFENSRRDQFSLGKRQENMRVRRRLPVAATVAGIVATVICGMCLFVAHGYLLLILWGYLFMGVRSDLVWLGLFKVLTTYVVIALLVASIIWRKQVPAGGPIVLAIVSGGLAWWCHYRKVFDGFEEWLVVDGVAPLIMAVLMAVFWRPDDTKLPDVAPQ